MVRFQLSYVYIYIFFAMIFVHVVESLSGYIFGLTSKILSILLVISILMILRFFKIRKKKITILSKYFIYLILFLFYKILILLIYNSYYEEVFDIRGVGGIARINAFTQGIIVWIGIGIGFAYSLIRVRINELNCMLLLVAMLFLLLFFTSGSFYINYEFINSSRENHITHLTLNGFIVFLCLFVQSQTERFFYFCILLNLTILFIIGGRSDFIVFFISLLLYNVLFNIQTSKNLVFLLMFTFVLMFIIFVFSFVNLQYFDRVLIIFTGNDESAQARKDFFMSNVDNLKNLIFIGNPNFHIEKYNEWGRYIHNILSAWEFYGMLYFIIVLYFSLLIIKFIVSYKSLIGNIRCMRFFGLLYIFSFISLLLSKVIFYYPFWFSLGGIIFYMSFLKVNSK